MHRPALQLPLAIRQFQIYHPLRFGPRAFQTRIPCSDGRAGFQTAFGSGGGHFRELPVTRSIYAPPNPPPTTGRMGESVGRSMPSGGLKSLSNHSDTLWCTRTKYGQPVQTPSPGTLRQLLSGVWITGDSISLVNIHPYMQQAGSRTFTPFTQNVRRGDSTHCHRKSPEHNCRVPPGPPSSFSGAEI